MYSCGRPWSVREVVLVPYVGAVVAVTVMCKLFLVGVCMLRECEGTMVTAMLVWWTGGVWLGWVQGMSMWVVHVV